MSHSYGITEYPNTFKRQGSFPLDKTNVFNSLIEANEYAESSKIAYEGQVISVIDSGDVNVYVLKKNDDVTKNFKLVHISVSSSGTNDNIIDMNNLINSKVGIWSITEKSNTNDAILDFDIFYGLDANMFEVYYNDELVSNKLALSDEFITNLNNFIDDSIIIKLKFYNDELKVFELEAKPLYKNKTVIFGSLHLIKL